MVANTVYYSTGPIENTKSKKDIPGASNNVIVKVLNNDKKHKAFVEIKFFRLNGKKHLIGSAKLTVGPGKSVFRKSNISNTLQYEVQIKVTGDADNVLLGVFGKRNGTINPSQRVLHSELTKIDRDSW
jgi:hypothetical protein